MALGRMMKGLFGGGRGAAAGPLGLDIGVAIQLHPTALEHVADKLWFTPSPDPLGFTAQGHIDFGDGSMALRYYTDDHEMLQIICAGGVDDSSIQEVKLFVPLGSIYPEDEGWHEWEGENSRIGHPVFTLDDGPDYQRDWFKDDPGWAAPVEFAEHVIDDANDENQVVQHVMLFARSLNIEPAFREYLLLSKEEHPDGHSVEALLGIDLEPGMFHTI